MEVFIGPLVGLYVGVKFPDAAEAFLIERCTWPSAAVLTFDYVDVLSWYRRLNSAMSPFTQRSLHGIGPLPVGDGSGQIPRQMLHWFYTSVPRSSKEHQL